MKRMILFRRLLLTLLILLTACANLPSDQTPPAPAPVSTASPTPDALPLASPVAASRWLRLWLPPQFDPNSGTPAARLLKARLAEFAARHPEIRLDIRLKTNLLENLALTRAAAPDVLPDLVALSHAEMEAAAVKGYIHPLSGLTDLPYAPDWYPYARQLGLIQNTPYGLAFAGDVLVLVYHPSQLGQPPADWPTLFAQSTPLALAGGDPNALFALNLYLSLGGNLLDAQNHPTLEKEPLTDVLTFFAEGSENKVFSKASLAYSSEQEVWQAFRRGDVPIAVIWLSQFLQTPLEDAALLPLTGLDGSPHTLADGWLWTLAGSQPENQPLAVELATWLMDQTYLPAWVEAAGYLPPRPTALAGRADRSLRPLLEVLAGSAQAMPSAELSEALGPPLQRAVNRLLNGDPLEVVVDEALQQLP